MRSSSLRMLAHTSLIAAIYVLLTLLSSVFGLSAGMVQLRFSECLYFLCLYQPQMPIGLFIGCVLANLVTGCPPTDIAFGSLATLIGAYGVYFLRKHPFAALWMPVLSNALILPVVWRFAYGLPENMWLVSVGIAALEEALACVLGGMILNRVFFVNKR